MALADDGNTMKSSQPPSPADWERHKAIIKDFYIEDSMTLQELMEVMRTRYNFIATTRSYKRRLKDWNIRKNVRLPPGAVEQAQAMLTAIGRADHPHHPCPHGGGDGDNPASSPSVPGGYHQDLVRLPGGQTVRAERLASHLRRKRKPNQPPPWATTAAAAAAGAGIGPDCPTMQQQQQLLQQQHQLYHHYHHHHHHHYHHHQHQHHRLIHMPRPRAPMGGHALCETEAVLAHARAYILGRFADQALTPDACDQRSLADWALSEGRWAGFQAELMRALGEQAGRRQRVRGGEQGVEGEEAGKEEEEEEEEEEEGGNSVLQCLRRTPGELTTLVKAQSANLITHVFIFLQGLARHAAADATTAAEGRQLLKVVRSLARYMAGYTASPEPQGMGLPSGHPLPRLFQSLSRVDDGQLLSAATQSCKLSCKTWDTILGFEGSCVTTGSWIALGSMSSSDELPPDFLDTIDATLQRFERTSGRADFRCHTMLSQRVSYLTMAARDRGLDPDLDDGVLATSLDLLGREPLSDETRLSALQNVTRCYLARGELQEAKERFCVLAGLVFKGVSPSVVVDLDRVASAEDMRHWLDRFQAYSLLDKGEEHQLEAHVYLEGIMRGGSPARVINTPGSDTRGPGESRLGTPESVTKALS